MSALDREDRAGTKWDRAARYLKTAMILYGHPEGITVAQIAEQVGVSKRTTYRDLAGMERDAGLPIWQDGPRWGLESDAFLPPLKLTLHEALTLYLAARVLAKTSDEHDPELIGAFVKLASVLPPVLAAHVQATVDVVAAMPRNATFTRVLRVLTEAWAGRRVVEIEYESGTYDPARAPRRTRVHPEAIEPSALTHALYLMGWDEERQARRTFKVERIRAAAMTPKSFEAPPGASAARDLRQAWDIIADQPEVGVVLRFSPEVARRVAETRWHPTQRFEFEVDGSLLWRCRVPGLHEIQVWVLGWGADVEVIEPPELRSSVAAQVRRAAGLYGAPGG